MTSARVTESRILLTPAILQQLGAGEGDDLLVIPTQDGVHLRKADPIVAQQMEIAKEVMDERRDVLRRLAE